MDFLSSLDSGLLLDSLSEALVIIDPNGIIQFSNTACEDLFGYQKDELLDQNIKILMPPNDASQHDHHLSNYNHNNNSSIIGSALDRPLCGQKKDLTVFPIDVKITVTKQNEHTYIIGVIRNLSELINSHNRLNQVISSIDTVLFTLQFSHNKIKTLWVSPNISSQLGYTEQEASKEDWWLNNIHPEDKPLVIAQFRNFLLSGQLTNEYRFKNNSGDYIWIEDHLTINSDSSTQLLYSSWHNVTERKQLTASLLQSEQRLTQSQNFAKIGTWDWNIQTGELYWSDMIPPLFGHPDGQLETSYANFVSALHPEDMNSVMDAIHNCIHDNTDYDIEHRVVWPDGTVRWVHEKGNVLRDKYNQPLNMIGVVSDIHTRKTFELKQEIFNKQLLDATTQAEAANKAKSVFLSSMNHELRTPLNSILGFSQLLNMETDLSHDNKESVTNILKSGEHLLSLINDVLDLAKIEAGKTFVDIKPVLTSELLNICETIILPLALQHQIDIKFSKNCKDDLYILADSTKLRQVIINLLSNAIKYNKQNGHVLVDCVKDETEQSLTISIKDNGPGISTENLTQLFEPFNRLGQEESSNIEGSGIGLVITKQLLKLMNSELKVSSTVEIGSEFCFSLPYSTTDDTLESSTYLIPTDATLNTIQKTSKLVYYIDYNELSLNLIHQYIKKWTGYKFLGQCDPKTGIEDIQKYSPDIILLDINIPKMSGYEILNHLHSNNICPDAKIIAVTANAWKTDILKIQQAGFDDYIDKPIIMNELFEKLNQKKSRYENTELL